MLPQAFVLKESAGDRRKPLDAASPPTDCPLDLLPLRTTGPVMKTILIYPAFTDRAVCANFFCRVLWYLSPYDRYVSKVQAFGPFDSVPLEIPDFIDPTAVKSPSGRKFRKKIAFETAPDGPDAWKRAMAAADVVLVWQLPETRENDPFVSLAKMREAFGPTKVFGVDEQVMKIASSSMMSSGLTLMDDEERQLADSRRKLGEFKKRITKPVGYVFGTGPSLEEAWRYDYSDGHTIVCNSIVKNAPLLDKLQPIALAAVDPIFHAGPSTYAAAYRAGLMQCMEERDFHVFIPWRDYAVYLTYMPEKFHERIIGIPLYMGDDYNIDLEAKFSLLGLPNVLTLMLLPVAATFFQHVGISGCDGRPLSQDSYFWGHHKASQFSDQMDAIQLAHPGFFSISYNDYYLRHCTETERLCQDIEKAGKSVHAITGSFIPALRKRGAAEPMHPPKGEADVPPMVLSLAPDLEKPEGEIWAVERRLAAKVEAGGLPYGIIANARLETVLPQDSEAARAVGSISYGLKIGSRYLLEKKAEGPKAYEMAYHRVQRELASSLEGALLATEGRVHAYLRRGSLEHAEILYAFAGENPRLSVQVNLHWFESQSVWEPNFLRRWMWLLQAATSNPRLTLTCATEHQARALEARSGLRLPVTAQPSAALDDDQAWALLNRPAATPNSQRILLYGAKSTLEGDDERRDIATAIANVLPQENSEILITERLPSVASGEDDLAGRVTLLDPGVGDENYLDLLESCRAVVLPQLPPDFADRTASIAVDALYAGAPLVTQRGTSFAEIAKAYTAGLVTDEGTPEEVADEIVTLLERSNGQRTAQRLAAKSYYRENSWHRLAQEIIETVPSAEASPLVPAALESEVVAVPLIGPLPRAQASRAREVLAVGDLLSAMGVGFAQARLVEQAPMGSLQLLSSDGRGLAIVPDARSQGAMQSQAEASDKALAKDLQIALAQGKDSAALLEQAVAFAATMPNDRHRLLVLQAPALAPDALDLIQALAPLAAVIAFDDAIAPCHAALAEALDAMGYLVLVSEHHPQLQKGDANSAWRIAAYPFFSDLPWARGRLLVLPPNASLGYTKHLLVTTGDDMAFVDADDPVRRGMEIWADAGPLDPQATLAFAAAPNKLWKPEGFTVTGKTPEGLTRMEESEAMRVHRTYIPAQAQAGSPITLSVDCAGLGRRFVMLWLSDKKSQPRAGAIFDLQSGALAVIESQLEDKSLVIEAAGAAIGQTTDGKPIYRFWLTVPAYPQDEEILGQVLTRAATAGGRQHKGMPGHGLLLRDLLLEAAAGPSKVRKT
ncbi:MAG: hypothetical protein Kilf2KO_39630 [Rhodospirillales bacterium]